MKFTGGDQTSVPLSPYRSVTFSVLESQKARKQKQKGKKGREGILALQSNFFFNSILRLLYIYFFVATNIMSGNSWEQPVRRVFSDWMIFEENDT